MITFEMLNYLLLKAKEILILSNVAENTQYNCISKFLFFKRFSDLTEEEKKDILQQGFYFPIDFKWTIFLASEVNIKLEIKKLECILDEENPQLNNIFTRTNDIWYDIDVQYLNKLTNLFEQFNLSTSNLLAPNIVEEAFEYFIENIASPQLGEQSTTPQTLVNLMVQLLNPQECMAIYDPACGYGRLLIGCTRYIHKLGVIIEKNYFYGQEINLNILLQANLNVLLHGIYNFDFRLEDTLVNPQFIQDTGLMKFDRVIVNPPFGLKNRSFYNLYYRGYLSTDFAFIDHIIKSLNQQGLAVVLQPPGTLIRAGADGRLRKTLIQNDLIEAIIALPKNLFFSSSVPPIIFIFNNKKLTIRKNKILIVDATSSDDKKGKSNLLLDEKINKIVDICRNFKEEEGYSKIVTHQEIQNNDYNLSINRYVLPIAKLIPSLGEIKAQLNQLTEQQKEMKEQLEKYLRDLEI